MGEAQPLTGTLAKIIAAQPLHIQAGLLAYRAALNERKDWHAAVIAAIEEADQARVSGSV